MDNIEKASDDRNRMDMSDDKESNNRYQISKNVEERVTDDRAVFKLGKLSSRENDDNIGK